MEAQTDPEALGKKPPTALAMKALFCMATDWVTRQSTCGQPFWHCVKNYKRLSCVALQATEVRDTRSLLFLGEYQSILWGKPSGETMSQNWSPSSPWPCVRPTDRFVRMQDESSLPDSNTCQGWAGEQRWPELSPACRCQNYWKSC